MSAGKSDVEDRCRGAWVGVQESCVKARGRGICSMMGEMPVGLCRG